MYIRPTYIHTAVWMSKHIDISLVPDFPYIYIYQNTHRRAGPSTSYAPTYIYPTYTYRAYI